MSENSQSAPSGNPCPRSLHWFAKVLVVLTFLLITVGGLVTSNDAGLSVPDWPTTYGQNMFTFPLSGMVGGILYEHGHRLLASGVGFLTIILAVWVSLSDRRRWMKVLGWICLAAVILQGVLGGLTVRYFLPPEISVSHASLALIFFCMTITVAFATSTRWSAVAARWKEPKPAVFRFAVGVVILIFLQILMGAYMRHTYDREVGLAVVGFPFSNGQLIPEFTDSVVLVHFIHRWFAFIVAGAIVAFGFYVLTRAKDLMHLVFPSIVLLMLILTQIMLGILTVLTERMTLMTTLHQANGALLFGIAYMIALRSLFPSEARAEEKETVKEGRSNEYALQV
ncbi:MAG: heme A synthase [Candidatus Omnitrophica bacterium]|nr:heme A synthase [Candidatus Omnitrophota bacterium]